MVCFFIRRHSWIRFFPLSTPLTPMFVMPRFRNDHQRDFFQIQACIEKDDLEEFFYLGMGWIPVSKTCDMQVSKQKSRDHLHHRRRIRRDTAASWILEPREDAHYAIGKYEMFYPDSACIVNKRDLSSLHRRQDGVGLVACPVSS